MPLALIPLGNSLISNGSVAAPGNGGVICNIPAVSLKAATYHIHGEAWYGAVAGAVDDMALTVAGSTVFAFNLDAVANSNTPIVCDFVRQLDGASAVAIVALGGVAGNYKGNLIVTKVQGS